MVTQLFEGDERQRNVCQVVAESRACELGHNFFLASVQGYPVKAVIRGLGKGRSHIERELLSGSARSGEREAFTSLFQHDESDARNAADTTRLQRWLFYGIIIQ